MIARKSSLYNLVLLLATLLFSGASIPFAYSIEFQPPLAIDMKVTSPQGFRKHPITGINKAHEGTDFSAPMSSKIFAVAAGDILDAGYNPVAGHFLHIQHANGWSSRYLHLQYRYAQKGQKISKGELIALSGNTGRSTGPHLHFELRYKGKPVDPLPLLKNKDQPLLIKVKVSGGEKDNNLVADIPRILMVNNRGDQIWIVIRHGKKLIHAKPNDVVLKKYQVIKAKGRYQLVSYLPQRS